MALQGLHGSTALAFGWAAHSRRHKLQLGSFHTSSPGPQVYAGRGGHVGGRRPAGQDGCQLAELVPPHDRSAAPQHLARHFGGARWEKEVGVMGQGSAGRRTAAVGLTG